MNTWLVMEIYAKFHESVSVCTPLTSTNQVFKTKPFFCASMELHGSELWISTEKLPCDWTRCNVLKDEATSYGKCYSYSMANYLRSPSPPPHKLRVSYENHLVTLCFGWARWGVVWRRKTDVVFGGEILENTEGGKRAVCLQIVVFCSIWEVLWKWETGKKWCKSFVLKEGKCPLRWVGAADELHIISLRCLCDLKSGFIFPLWVQKLLFKKCQAL